jgi:Ca-activated chloride channel homolog
MPRFELEVSSRRESSGKSTNLRPSENIADVSSWRLVTDVCGFMSLIALKLCRWLADNSFVRRSALLTGLSLAMCGITLAGIGEWASGRFDSSSAVGGRESASASPSEHDIGAAVMPTAASLPLLPEGSNHLPADTPDYTFRRDVPEVRLQFTVADEQGRIVQDLSPDDVRVFDNQEPVERFQDFERAQDLPLRLGLVVDTSDSVKRVLADEKAAAAGFLDSVMRPQGDSAFIMAFGGDIKIWQTATANRQDLNDAIARLKQPGWGTRFFDALYAACSGGLLAASGDKMVHRAIVVLSDGDDTDSLHNLRDVVASAERSEIQVYALTIRNGSATGRGDQILQRLTEATGGRLYVAQSVGDLRAAFAQIERDLRTQYYVSFRPQQSTPGFHSLRLEVRPSQKLEIHARQGYYAMAQ